MYRVKDAEGGEREAQCAEREESEKEGRRNRHSPEGDFSAVRPDSGSVEGLPTFR